MESPEGAEEAYSNSGKNSPNRAEENQSPGENYWQKSDENAVAAEVALHSQPSERLLNKFSFGKPTPVDTGETASQPTTKMGMMTSLLKDMNYVQNRESAPKATPLQQIRDKMKKDSATPQMSRSQTGFDEKKDVEMDATAPISIQSTPLGAGESQIDQKSILKEAKRKDPKVFQPLAAQIITIDDDEADMAMQRDLQEKPSTHTKEQTQEKSRIEIMKKNYEKRVQEKWRKALKALGINENLYPNKKDDLFNFCPFNEASIGNVRRGNYNDS